MTALARRFYKTALPTPADGVALDQRTLRTPGGAVFAAPTAALAAAVAAEWEAQGEEIIPASMPLSQLAFAAIDWAPVRRDELVHYVGAYIETDLCAHRAEAPAELAARQSAAWDPLLAWAAEAHGLTPPVVSGIIAADADPAMREHLAAYARALDDFPSPRLRKRQGSPVRR
ncbi:MAG: ATP12 family chaperone protein [Terricaulis sp.]|nr:ATP12 family chaperone protein [Terricaulis sp.]